MSIIRVLHNRENPYVQLNKEALWNPGLSLGAVGLWARCMSRPDNWTFRVKELAAKCMEGKDAIYSKINELIKAGYVVRLDVTDHKGGRGNLRGKVFEYIFLEIPLSPEERGPYIEELKKCFRRTGLRDLVNPPILNTHIPKIPKVYKKKKEGGKPPAPPPPPPDSFFSLNKVKMLVEAFNLLVQDYGRERVLDMVIRLDLYGDSEPAKFKRYACHAAVIRRWLMDDDKKGQSKTKTKANQAKATLDAVKQKYPKHKGIVYGHDYIEFSRGAYCKSIKLSEPSFREKLIQELTKLGLSHEGI
jgi:hypothetical protein